MKDSEITNVLIFPQIVGAVGCMNKDHLISCPQYAESRGLLVDELGVHDIDVELLLKGDEEADEETNKKTAFAVQRYILRTRRFC